jgi:AAHS family 3-hydroxyphenylpropionic acid transporter
MTATTATAAPAYRGAALTVGLCFLVTVLEGFDIQAIGVAAPKLGAELKLAKDVLGEALAASNIGLVIGAVIGGWLADRLGRKTVLIAAVLGFGVFTLMTMASHSFDVLFAARLGAGLGCGAALPNIMALAAEVAKAGRRGSTGALMFCGMPMGGGIVALISWQGVNLDWRALFLLGGVSPLVLAPLLFFLMKEPPRATDPTRTAATWQWLGLIPVYAVSWAILHYIGSLPGAGSISQTAIWLALLPTAITGYMVVHRKALFGEGRALPSIFLWVTFFPTLLILYLVLNWLPTLVIAKGFKTEASQASVWFNFASIAGALLLGRLVDRFGLRWPMVTAFLGLIATLFALAAATDLTVIMVLSGLLGFFVLGANYALYGAAAAFYPEAIRGRGAGGAVGWGRIGAVCGPLLGGFLLQGGSSAGTVVQAMTPFAVIALVGVVLLTLTAQPER